MGFHRLDAAEKPALSVQQEPVAANGEVSKPEALPSDLDRPIAQHAARSLEDDLIEERVVRPPEHGALERKVDREFIAPGLQGVSANPHHLGRRVVFRLVAPRRIGREGRLEIHRLGGAGRVDDAEPGPHRPGTEPWRQECLFQIHWGHELQPARQPHPHPLVLASPFGSVEAVSQAERTNGDGVWLPEADRFGYIQRERLNVLAAAEPPHEAVLVRADVPAVDEDVRLFGDVPEEQQRPRAGRARRQVHRAPIPEHAAEARLRPLTPIGRRRIRQVDVPRNDRRRPRRIVVLRLGESAGRSGILRRVVARLGKLLQLPDPRQVHPVLAAVPDVVQFRVQPVLPDRIARLASYGRDRRKSH